MILLLHLYQHTFLFKTQYSKAIQDTLTRTDKMATAEGDTLAAQASGSDSSKQPVRGEPLRTVTFEISVPNLRNGALANIQQAAVRSAMQPLYYWAAIKNLAPERAVDAAEHVFRATKVSLDMGFGSEMTSLQREENRKWAVVLAGVRAGAMAAWRLGVGDMTLKEIVNAGMEQVGDVIVQTAGGSTSTAKWTAARSLEPLTDVEMQALGMCAYMGMAVPILQGASLIQTGHHYVPSTYKLFEGIKRQAVGSVSSEVGAWVTSMGERFNDLAFHKACHPISPNLKRELAIRPDIAMKLSASGHGSASIRLPAIPSEATGGKAALALVRSANRVIAEMDKPVDIDRGIALMASLEEAELGEARSAACDAVVAWVEENAGFLAFCAGIVQQVHDSSGTGQSTLLSAYSVKKLMSANPTEVSKGVAFARASADKTRQRMERGEYKIGVERI
jgi:hypothetical protein